MLCIDSCRHTATPTWMTGSSFGEDWGWLGTMHFRSRACSASICTVIAWHTHQWTEECPVYPYPYNHNKLGRMARIVYTLWNICLKVCFYHATKTARFWVRTRFSAHPSKRSLWLCAYAFFVYSHGPIVYAQTRRAKWTFCPRCALVTRPLFATGVKKGAEVTYALVRNAFYCVTLVGDGAGIQVIQKVFLVWFISFLFDMSSYPDSFFARISLIVWLV